MSFVSGPVSGILGKQASDRQSEAIEAGSKREYDMWKQNREDLLPLLWNEIKRDDWATDRFADLNYMAKMGVPEFDYEGSDAFDFYLSEGVDDIMKQSAGNIGGSTMKAIEDYRMGLASTYYDKAYSQHLGEWQTNFDNMGTAAGLGKGSSVGGTLSNASSTTGANLSNSAAEKGAAEASNYLNWAGIANQNSQNAQQYVMSRYLGNYGGK